MATVTQIDTPGLGPRKTFLVMVTVVGCIAILWPKVFYPMMFAGYQKPLPAKEHRNTVGCCDVVLDRDTFLNTTQSVGEFYRKKLNLMTGEISLRQERPPHLRPDTMHPAMRERGRAIPNTQTVPILDRPRSAADLPRIVEGRPGPLPGMRPVIGAGSVHPAQPKGNTMGFIMPLYTIGICAFFLYTIIKIVCRKPVPNAPYGPAKHDPQFRNEVFGQENSFVRRPDDRTTKLGWKEHETIVTAIQGLIDAADEEMQNKRSTNKEKKISTLSQNGNISNGHAKPIEDTEPQIEITQCPAMKPDELETNLNFINTNDKKKDGSVERTVTVIGMELTASCEGGQKWNRPLTPVFISPHEHSSEEESLPEPQSIFLEGSLPHESQILVADEETYTENIIDTELNGTNQEPAVVLSSKMTLSLINLSSSGETDDDEQINNDSPISNDIEVINGVDKDI